jgi:Na+/H+-dicarboxylate symporter
MTRPLPHNLWYRILYVQVIIAVVLGIIVGKLWPDFGKALKPLGDGFIALVKMMIGPIIFCTVVMPKRGITSSLIPPSPTSTVLPSGKSPSNWI